MGDKTKLAGAIAMLLTALLWSAGGLAIKMADWNPFAIAGARSLLASLMILVWLRRPEFTFSMPQIAAAVANALTMLFFVIANKTTTAANAILLQYTAPVFTAFIGAWLLKEKTRPEHWVSIVFIMAGMAIMFADKIGGGGATGDAIALLSAVTFSLYLVFIRMQKNASPLESILLSHWIVAGVCLFASFFQPLPQLSAKSAAAILVLGILQIGIPSFLIVYALKRISALSANLIAVAEPVLNPLWVFLFLGERPGLNTLVGGAIIIASVAAASLVGARRHEE
jgi:drug/metabolite transporter (DMT)-like permease